MALQTRGSLIKKEVSKADSVILKPGHLVGYTVGQKMDLEFIEYMTMYKIKTPGVVLISPCHSKLKSTNIFQKKSRLKSCLKWYILINLFTLMFAGAMLMYYVDGYAGLMEVLIDILIF